MGEARGADEQEEKLIKSSYTGIPDSMLRHEYQVSLNRYLAVGRNETNGRPHFG